jgi:DNA (cytosine-5)-methyltransferase 1
MGQGRFVHPIRARTITPHEAARIQGFPDFFDFGAAETLTDLRDMIANAVPPALAAAVLVQLFQPEKVSKGIRDR